MKIEKRVGPARTGKVNKTRAKGTAAEVRPSSTAGADRVEIGSASTTLRMAEEALETVDVADTAKVAAVKSAIDGGTFQVDAEVVADKLIDSAKESVKKHTP